jgi:hypothetical protein
VADRIQISSRKRGEDKDSVLDGVECYLLFQLYVTSSLRHCDSSHIDSKEFCNETSYQGDIQENSTKIQLTLMYVSFLLIQGKNSMKKNMEELLKLLE